MQKGLTHGGCIGGNYHSVELSQELSPKNYHDKNYHGTIKKTFLETKTRGKKNPPRAKTPREIPNKC
jgi:hypothetical protein